VDEDSDGSAGRTAKGASGGTSGALIGTAAGGTKARMEPQQRMQQLIQEGWLVADEEVRFEYRGKVFVARVTSDGCLAFNPSRDEAAELGYSPDSNEEGGGFEVENFQNPTSFVKAIAKRYNTHHKVRVRNGRVNFSGWECCRTAQGKSLAELKAQMLEELKQIEEAPVPVASASAATAAAAGGKRKRSSGQPAVEETTHHEAKRARGGNPGVPGGAAANEIETDANEDMADSLERLYQQPRPRTRRGKQLHYLEVTSDGEDVEITDTQRKGGSVPGVSGAASSKNGSDGGAEKNAGQQAVSSSGGRAERRSARSTRRAAAAEASPDGDAEAESPQEAGEVADLELMDDEEEQDRVLTELLGNLDDSDESLKRERSERGKSFGNSKSRGPKSPSRKRGSTTRAADDDGAGGAAAGENSDERAGGDDEDEKIEDPDSWDAAQYRKEIENENAVRGDADGEEEGENDLATRGSGTSEKGDESGTDGDGEEGRGDAGPVESENDSMPEGDSSDDEGWRLDEMELMLRAIREDHTIGVKRLSQAKLLKESKMMARRGSNCVGIFMSQLNRRMRASELPSNCSVAEVAAFLAAEVSLAKSANAFTSSGRRGSGGGDGSVPDSLRLPSAKQSERDRKEKLELDRIRKRHKRELEDVKSRLEAEMGARRDLELEKSVLEIQVKEAKRHIERESKARAVLEEDCEELKLKELEARRRLDRAKLKIASLRGEMIVSTVDSIDIQTEDHDDSDSPRAQLPPTESAAAPGVDPAAQPTSVSLQAVASSSIPSTGDPGVVHLDAKPAVLGGSRDGVNSVDAALPLASQAVAPSNGAVEANGVSTVPSKAAGKEWAALHRKVLEEKTQLMHLVRTLQLESAEWQRQAEVERKRFVYVMESKARLEYEHYLASASKASHAAMVGGLGGVLGAGMTGAGGNANASATKKASTDAKGRSASKDKAKNASAGGKSQSLNTAAGGAFSGLKKGSASGGTGGLTAGGAGEKGGTGPALSSGSAAQKKDARREGAGGGAAKRKTNQVQRAP